MRILVAGGTGFLGRSLLAALGAGRTGSALDRGSSTEVLVLSRQGAPDPGSGEPPDAADTGHGPATPSGARVRHIAGEWTEASRDERILDFAPQVVVNLVGDSHPRSSIGREADEIAAHVLPFLRLIEALEPQGLERVVFSSSAGSLYRSGRDAVLKERADTAYHSTKRSIEHYLSSRSAASGLHAISLRISNPIGDLDRPGFGLVGHVARAVAVGDEIDFIGDYATPKDYVVLDDVGAALAAAVGSSPVEGEPGHHVLDVGSGWSIDAPGMYKVVRSLAEDGLEPDRSPLDYGFGPSDLDLEPMRALVGWQPTGDLLASIDRLVRRHRAQVR